MGFLAGLLDPKKSGPIVAALATVLVQLAAARGWALDVHTADALSASFVGLGFTWAATHAHVEHAETHADANVQVATINAGQPVAGATGPIGPAAATTTAPKN